MTFDILDAIYSDGSPQQLESIINRSKTRTDTWLRLLYGEMHQSFMYKIPRSEDRFLIGLDGSYRSEKNNVWRDYDINYGPDPTTATRRRQYTDNTPNHDLGLSGRAVYQTVVGGIGLGVMYLYEFEDKTRDSYMFALDRLNDMGIYGVLPADYLDAFDPKWSNTSRSISNSHTVNPNINIFKRLADSRTLMVMVSPRIVFHHRHFDYHRDGRDYPLSTQNNYVSITSPYDGRISYRFGGQGGQDPRCRNELTYEFNCMPALPQLYDMIDIVNDADPLNVYLGNPDLKPEYTISNNLYWKWTPFSKSINNSLQLHYSVKNNSLTRGYTYDTATGVRYNRMYNVDGNWSAQIHNTLSWQFGSTKQFTLSSSTEGVLSGNTDMIGVDRSEPELSKVKYWSIGQNTKLAWNLGSQLLQLRCDFVNRHTSSHRDGFNSMDAYHINYGLSGIFKLPAGFGISTDFVCYTRRGYGAGFLDTTDPIWNTRLSYTSGRNNRWLFTVDAFDMLHKLSNVHYAVTASGRTVSYSNALPRYILATVQYRFSIQPKRP